MGRYKITPGGRAEMETKRHKKIIKKKNAELCRITNKEKK